MGPDGSADGWLRRHLPSQRTANRIQLGFGVACLLALGLGGWHLLTTQMDGAHAFSPFEGNVQPPLRQTAADGTSYELRLGGAIIALDMAGEDAASRQVYPDYAAALRGAHAAGLPTMPSVSLVLAACRTLDWRLQSAVERRLDVGGSGRPALLTRWLAAVLARRETAAGALHDGCTRAALHLARAIAAGGGRPALPADLAIPTSSTPSDTPIGPWGEAEDLGRIWRRDRLLADDLGVDADPDATAVAILVRTMAADQLLRAGWARQAAVAEAWTGHVGATAFEDLLPVLAGIADDRLADADVARLIRTRIAAAPRPGGGTAVAPRALAWSSTPEEEILAPLGMRAWRDQVGELADAVMAGRIDLAPRPDAGFYRRRWYALETLAAPGRAPETDKLQLSADYRNRWRRAFAAGFTEGRSGIIKRLPMMTLGCAGGSDGRTIEIAPQFTAEPAPIVYLRLARAYRALAGDLERGLGGEEWRSLTDASGDPLADAVGTRATLLFGLAARTYAELGFPLPRDADETGIDAEAAMRQAMAWAADAADDRDVTADARLLVTLASDDAGRMRCPAIAGVRLEPVVYRWTTEPSVRESYDPSFIPARYWLPSPCAVTTTVTTVPTPAAFRASCDGHPTVGGIYASFGERPPTLRHPRLAWLPYALAIPVACILLVALSYGWTRLRRRGHRWMGPALAAGALASVLIIMGAPPYPLVRWVAATLLPSNDNLAMLTQARFADWSRGQGRRLFFDLAADPDPQVRYMAVWLPLDVTPAGLDATAVATLQRLCSDPLPELAEGAWYLRCRSPEPAASLLTDLEDISDPHRLSAALWSVHRRLGEDPAFAATVLRIANSGTAARRATMLRAASLWDSLPAGLLEPAHDALNNPDPGLRSTAARLVGCFGDDGEVARLLPLWRDQEATVRIAAFRALTRRLARAAPGGSSYVGQADWSAADVQTALAVYACDPRMTADERLSAAHLITDRGHRLEIESQLLPVARSLPSEPQNFAVALSDGFNPRLHRERAMTAIVCDWLAPSLPPVEDAVPFDPATSFPPGMLPGMPVLAGAEPDFGDGLRQRPALLESLAAACERNRDPRTALPILQPLATSSDPELARLASTLIERISAHASDPAPP